MAQTPESQQQFGSILTILGETAENNGKLLNKQIEFTHIAIGDANDEYVQPDRNQTALVNELARIPVNSVDVLQPTPDSVPVLKVAAILPDDVNDLVIREFSAVATFNGKSYFHAVGNCARIYVPPPVNNGNVSTPVTLEMIFVITSVEPIIEIDPSSVIATREYVQHKIVDSTGVVFSSIANMIAGKENNRVTVTHQAGNTYYAEGGIWKHNGGVSESIEDFDFVGEYEIDVNNIPNVAQGNAFRVKGVNKHDSGVYVLVEKSDLPPVDTLPTQNGKVLERQISKEELCGFDASKTNFVEKAKSQSWVGRGYLKSDMSKTKFYVGFEHSRYQSSEYRLYFNTDNFLMHEGSYVGDSIGVYILPTLSGSFITSTTDNMFASKVGDSFSFSFEGTGLNFHSLTDDRGGLWNFSIDGGEDIPISVWSSETVAENTILVADNLSPGLHNVVATYAGADPLNPPSNGGVGRGWLKYDHAGTGVTTATPIPALAGKPNDKGIELGSSQSNIQALAAGTVFEFALKCKKDGAELNSAWVPYHTGPGGNQGNVTLEIIVDGLVISNNPADLTDSIIFNDAVIFKQTYTAYNDGDLNTPLWEGVFTHKFSDGAMTTNHTIRMLEDTYCEQGYLSGMFAAQANHMDTLRYCNDFVYSPLLDWTGTDENHVMHKSPGSCCFHNTDSGAFSAFNVSLVDALGLNKVAQSVDNIFAQSRTNNLIKCYWTTFNDDILKKGDVFRATSEYVIFPYLESNF